MRTKETKNQGETEMKWFHITERTDAGIDWGTWAASSAKEAVEMLVKDIFSNPTSYFGFPNDIVIVEVK